MRRVWIILSLMMGSITLYSCSSGDQGGFTYEEYQKIGSALVRQELHREAAQFYWDMLNHYELDRTKKANVLYQIGNIYMDQLRDYRKALEAFTIIQTLSPEKKFSGKLDQKIVTCLEYLGRSLDATQQISRSVQVGKDQANNDALVVAEIGDRKVTLEEIENVIGKIPVDSTAKIELLQNYVGTELMARAAKRKGLEKNSQVVNKLRYLENQVLAQTNLQEEMKNIQLDEREVMEYFQMNRLKYGDSTVTFEKVKDAVIKDYLQKKQQAILSSYMQNLLQAADVRLYYENLSHKR